MKKLLMLASTLLLLCSCAPVVYYQVYDVEAEGLKDKGDLLVYENEDCAVSYSLWGEGGNLNFIFENKTNDNLYLIMPQCFLIHNGWALDYYDDNTYSYSSTNTMSSSVSAQASLYGYVSHYTHWHPATVTRSASIASEASKTNTVTIKAPKTICIPAKSSKVIEGFRLSNTVHLECDKTKANFPKKSANFMTFDKNNTPLYVNNVLSYSNDPEGTSIKKIENFFWVKTFTNYSSSAAIDSYVQKDCVTGMQTKVNTFKISQPNRFYNTYTKSTSRGSIVVSNTKDKKSKKSEGLFHDDIK